MIINEKLLSSFRQRASERLESEQREAAEKLERDKITVDTNKEKIAEVMVLAFKSGRGKQIPANAELLFHREDLGFDLTRIDPEAVCGNEHVMGVLMGEFSRFHPGKNVDPESDPRKLLKKAITGILTAFDHSGMSIF